LYVTKPVEFGQTLDVTPSVLDDGYTVALTVIPAVTDAGYMENPTNRVAVYVNGNKKWVTLDRPHIRQRQMPVSVRVRDGQTLVLRAPPAEPSENLAAIKDMVPVLADLSLTGRAFRSESETPNKKTLLIFVTPTLIDPAGNLIHAADETPLPLGGTPPQQAR
jgi:type II secretory pathway component GspD/PulD (secretin)